MTDTHRDRGPDLRGVLDRCGAAAETEQREIARLRNAVGRRRPPQQEIRAVGTGRPRAGGRAGRQTSGAAGHQQVEIAFEGAGLRAQEVVRGVFGVPHRHAGQRPRSPAHGAVTARGGDEVDAAAAERPRVVLAAHLIADDSGRLAAGDIAGEPGIDCGRAQPVPGVAHGFQDGRVGGAPGRTQLTAQRGPQAGIGEIRVAVGEGQQFQQAGIGAHQVDDVGGALGEIEQGQARLGGVVAGEPAHRLVRAEVGRAQHQEAAAGQPRDARPDRCAATAVGHQRAHHQTAHRMGHDVHRLVFGFGPRHQRLQPLGQPGGGGTHRLPPVVGEDVDPVGAREELDQRPVELIDQTAGFDQRCVHVQPPQAALEQREVVEPHRVAAHAQFAAHGARQHQRERTRLGGGLAARDRSAPARCLVRRPGDGLEAAVLAVGAQQAGRQPAHALRIDEVAEVIHLPAGIAHEAGAARRPVQAAGHRAGVHHQIVVGAVEPVGRQQLDLLPQRIALDVAGDHAQIRGGAQLGVVEQAGERGARHHRLGARQRARVGAFLHHREQEIHRVAEQAVTGQEIEHRQPAVQPAGGERGAARRTGHPHEAAHPDLPRLEFAQQRRQQCAIRLIGGVAGRFGGGVQRPEADLFRQRAIGGEQCVQPPLDQVEVRAFAQTQQFAHQPAARMTDQMQFGPLLQPLHQRQRIGDRAFGQRAVLEREHAIAVARGQPAAQQCALPVVRGPQSAEAAFATGSGTVQEHQQRPGGRRQRLARWQRCERKAVERAAVQAGRPPEALFLEAATERGGGQLIQIDAEEIQHADAQPDQATLTAGGRRRQSLHRPAGAAIAGHGAPAVLAHQIVGATPEDEAVIQLDANHIVGRGLELAGARVPRAARMQTAGVTQRQRRRQRRRRGGRAGRSDAQQGGRHRVDPPRGRAAGRALRVVGPARPYRARRC